MADEEDSHQLPSDRHSSESEVYINPAQQQPQPPPQQSLTTARDSSGYQKPLRVHRSQVRASAAVIAAVTRAARTSGTLGTPPAAAASEESPMAERGGPRAPPPQLATADRAATASGGRSCRSPAPVLPPRPEHQGRQSEPLTVREPQAHVTGIRGRVRLSSSTALFVVQLLVTTGLVAYYFTRFCSLQEMIRLSVRNNSVECLKDAIERDGTVRFVPDGSNIEPHFQFYKGNYSVRVLTDGDYRISANVCFRSLSAVTLEVRIDGSRWIQCHLSPVNHTSSSECCTLFSIKSMQRGEVASVWASKPEKLCVRQYSTSFSLEKR